jgi:DNA-binding transcriptional LysR family regulator
MIGMSAANLDDVRLFLEVARHASFVEASRRTGVPTSTVSRAIARVEAALGVRLLQRTSRRVVVTDDGARLVARAAPLFAELDDVMDGAVDRDPEPSGRLRITAPVVTGASLVAPAMVGFAARYPKVEVDLRLTNAVLSLVDEGIDLGFRAGPIRDAELVARRLMTLPYALAGSPGFVRAHLTGAPRVTAAALAELPALVGSPQSPWRLRRRDGSIEEVRPRARFAVNDPRVAVDAARRGLGVVRAPAELIAREGDALVPIAVAGATLEPGELFIVYPSRQRLPVRVRAAIDWMIRHVEAQQAHAPGAAHPPPPRPAPTASRARGTR